jgi:small redox-active disulfide protein 2
MEYNNLKFSTAKSIKVLGTGCSKCKSLEKATLQAVEELKLNAVVTKVEDIVEIMKYGVMSTPALVVDEKVLVYGKVPSSNEIKELLTK